MQDLRSVPNGGGANSGRFFGGDRRLRPYPNQALKCPRCDSINTKFCYYNNYNLSQPRHFCKNCRRYWTKGGVLRNVPVGGGCRKAKRSKPKSTFSLERKEKKENSNSSSDSSSLTAATTSTTTPANEVAACSSSVPPSLLDFSDSRMFLNQTPPSFEMDNLDQASDCGIFAESGSFTSLMNVGNSYNFSEVSPFSLNHEPQQQSVNGLQHKMQEVAGGCIDLTVEIDLRNDTNGELTALDWQTNQGLFDLPNTVDQGYWSQNQWTETDPHLYLP